MTAAAASSFDFPSASLVLFSAEDPPCCSPVGVDDCCLAATAAAKRRASSAIRFSSRSTHWRISASRNSYADSETWVISGVVEEETPPTPVDGADAGRGRRGGPAALLVEEIAGGLLTGGGGAVDAMFAIVVHMDFVSHGHCKVSKIANRIPKIQANMSNVRE